MPAKRVLKIVNERNNRKETIINEITVWNRNELVGFVINLKFTYKRTAVSSGILSGNIDAYVLPKNFRKQKNNVKKFSERNKRATSLTSLWNWSYFDCCSSFRRPATRLLIIVNIFFNRAHVTHAKKPYFRLYSNFGVKVNVKTRISRTYSHTNRKPRVNSCVRGL